MRKNGRDCWLAARRKQCPFTNLFRGQGWVPPWRRHGHAGGAPAPHVQTPLLPEIPGVCFVFSG
jgi:hypothetical protein